MTEPFHRFSRQVLEQRNAADLSLAVVEHPLGGIPAKEARGRVTAEVIDHVIEAFTQKTPR